MPQEFECPECGNTYDTKRGLHIHIGQKHPDQKEDILSELESEGEEWAEEEEIEKETKEGEEPEEIGPEEEIMDIEIIKNPWKIVSIVLLILLIGSVYFGFQGAPEKGAVEGKLGPEEAANKAVNYINQNLLQQGKAELVSVNETNGLYLLKLDISGRQFNSYLTKDGQLLFPQAVKIEETQPQQQEEVPKTETPTAQLFVFSYCPAGSATIGPFAKVADLFDNQADFKVRFFSNMHGEHEKQQNMIQECIQRIAPDKYWDYAKQYVKEVYQKCSSSRSKKCDKNESIELMKSVGINSQEVISCVKQNGKSYYKEDQKVASSLNLRYSPSFVINGEYLRDIKRSPEGIKSAICSAFQTPPEKCSQSLSTSGASAGGQC